MQASGYWTKISHQRLDRRRALAAAGAGALSAAVLAACGGGGKGSSGGGNIASLVTPPEDTSKEAKRGGTLLASRIQDAFTFDPHLGLAGSLGNTDVYSRLFKLKPGYLKAVGWLFEGDMFESWEFSPDKLVLTAKVRPNFKWHNVAPVNGRQVDAQDIAFSWNRYESVGQNRGSFATKANPDAPIESMTAVDSQTVRIKLSQPVGGLIGLLATTAAGMYFVPKEAESAFDPRNLCIGSGSWMLGENKASVSLTFKRHDGHYDAQRMYLDERKEFILPEYASSLAQFQTGALHRFAVRQEDVLSVKKQAPDLKLYVNQPPANHGIFKYGWNPALGAKTPFRDKRLRQAFAMAIDRDLLMETIFNLSRFASEGVNLRSYQYSAVQTSPSGVFGGDEAFWLDPKSKDFGPNARYYQYNVAEAKKLVAAAGYADGLQTVFHLSGGYGDQYVRELQASIGFAQAAGLNFQIDDTTLNSVFRPTYGDPQGDYDGCAARMRIAGGEFDSVEIAVAEFIAQPGIAYTGFFSEGGTWKQGDARYTTLLRQARQEFDAQKRRSLMYDFQRMEAEDQYMPSFVGTAENLALLWPAVRNYNVFQNSLPDMDVWIDPTRPPLGKA